MHELAERGRPCRALDMVLMSFDCGMAHVQQMTEQLGLMPRGAR